MRGSNFVSRMIYLCAILGLVLTYMGIMDLVRGGKTPADYNSMLEADVQKGMIVEGDLYANLGAFMESYTTRYGVKTGSSTYTYMIPIGEKQYMGLEGIVSVQDALDQQADATIDYLTGYSNAEPSAVHFKGRVINMDSETRGYLHDYMIDLGYTESEINEYILGYCIKIENYDGGIVELGIGVVLLLIALAVIGIPALKEGKKQENMSIYNQPAGGNPVGSVVEDDFNTFQQESTEYNTIGSGEDGVFQTNEETAENPYNSAYEAQSYSNPSDTEEKPQSELSLKLKDD